MKIAVLGPKGTYSDIAVNKYINDFNLKHEVIYYPSILKTGLAIDDDTLAILPFENTLDGMVIESLDIIANNRLNIISQLKLDIDFAFVSNGDISEVKSVFCQFKAHGQCLDFISRSGFDIITTQSNTESQNKLIGKDNTYGAIIPMHLCDKYSYKTVIEHIADSKNNQTRFFIVSKNKNVLNNTGVVETLIVVTIMEDRPGILYEILKEFHDLNINLNSIMSRPMKTTMGKYKFIIECSLESSEIKKLDDIKNNIEATKGTIVDILGIYNSL